MNKIFISTKTIVLFPILFIILLVINFGFNYYDNKNKMYDFVKRQAQTLNSFMMVHRNYYQKLYIDKTITLNKNTLLGLPAFSAYQISKTFSTQNTFNISVQTVSDRARNEKNQADSSELKAIAFFKANKNEKEYLKNEADFFQYASPLFIEKKCLSCHGDKTKAPGFIAQKYDKAYDYKLGELRGIISIKIPKKNISQYFSNTFIKSVFFDFLILLIILAIASYLIKYFKNLSQELELEVHNKTKELNNLANTDPLTGFGNRYKLNNDIRDSKTPALAIINMNNFSQVNDFYGHEIGDEIILKLGNIIAAMVEQENCDLYHLQGDEYVAFNPDITQALFIENIKKLTSHIRSTAIDIKDEKLTLNCSTAISFESKDNIFTTANMALKVAKKEHKDLVIYSDDISLNDVYKNNLLWANKIKKAIEEDKIVPFFQPIVNNKNGAWEKYETLVRLIDDDGSVISPYFFLDISKQTKYYTQITKIMIEKSFDTFKDTNLEFSINITIEDILNHDIKSFLFDHLKQYAIGNRLVLEIVESESIENFTEISKFIDEVKKHGCKIAIDDFGTGYSNFEYLLKLKSDYIKIDGSMIKNIDTNRDAKLVVSTIVDFAQKMGIKTIAEFVENESIENVVKELGIDYSQGYLHSKPKPQI